MAPSYLSRLAKKTRTVTEEDYDVGLKLAIHHAEDIDNPSIYPSVNERLYSVFGWITPGGDRILTPERRGSPNPTWDVGYHITLGKPTQGRFLHLEVVRIGSQSDPGTSTGKALVGRTQIPIPKEVSGPKMGRYGLVRLEGPGCKAEGYIVVSLEVVKELMIMEYLY